jgi:hypothetical protein
MGYDFSVKVFQKQKMNIHVKNAGIRQKQARVEAPRVAGE